MNSSVAPRYPAGSSYLGGDPVPKPNNTLKGFSQLPLHVTATGPKHGVAGRPPTEERGGSR